jgi:hypothetical protein
MRARHSVAEERNIALERFWFNLLMAALHAQPSATINHATLNLVQFHATARCLLGAHSVRVMLIAMEDSRRAVGMLSHRLLEVVNLARV